MLLIYKSMDMWKITCIVSLYSIDKLPFPSFFDLQPSPLAPNIFFCFSNQSPSYSLTFVICLMTLWIRQFFFSEYYPSNWLFYLGYSLEVSSYDLYVHDILSVTFSGHFITNFQINMKGTCTSPVNSGLQKHSTEPDPVSIFNETKMDLIHYTHLILKCPLYPTFCDEEMTLRRAWMRLSRIITRNAENVSLFSQMNLTTQSAHH